MEQEKNLAEQVFSGFCFFKVIENKSKVKTQTWKKNGFHCFLLDKRLQMLLILIHNTSNMADSLGRPVGLFSTLDAGCLGLLLNVGLAAIVV